MRREDDRDDVDADEPDGEDAESVLQRLASLRSRLTTLAPPHIPLTVPWEFSIASMAASAGAPKMVTRSLGLLDRFGAVRLTPDAVGFDSDDVSWDSITEIGRAHV